MYSGRSSSDICTKVMYFFTFRGNGAVLLAGKLSTDA